MKKIQINRLTLENFKCHRYLNLDFGARNRSVYGDNATGKTSIYDAVTWLLFGKDSAGNGEKNVSVKPLNPDGNVADHQAVTAVEAEFLENGEPVVFRRTLREVWAAKRGTGEPVFDGNTSDYFVDGVPCKKNAFDGKIKELVSEDLFRMLTSVTWFPAGMKWQDRRRILFDMAGGMDDRDVMLTDPSFQPLLDSLGKHSLDDYRLKLLAQKKGLTGTRDDVPTRINECMKTLEDLEGMDFEEARGQEADLLDHLEPLFQEKRDLEGNAALRELEVQLREAQLERRNVEAENRAYREKQEDSQPDLAAMEWELTTGSGRLEALKAMLGAMGRDISQNEQLVDQYREEWTEVNGQAFAGGKCPTCGQGLPFDQLQKATADFEAWKKKRLSQIQESAQRLTERIQADRERESQLAAETEGMEAHFRDLIGEMEAVRSQVREVRDMEDFAPRIFVVMEKISGLQNKIAALRADSTQAVNGVNTKIAAAEAQLRTVRGVIAQEAVKKRTMKRVEELRADAKNAAQALESIEKMLYLMEEFTRYKAKFVEDGINGMFREATFRLFREQANGGLEERCDVVYKGVPYTDLNNGAKINMGIDIINTLSRYYGVTVPLFVDNAESVTNLADCQAQVIRLVVSEHEKEVKLV